MLYLSPIMLYLFPFDTYVIAVSLIHPVPVLHVHVAMCASSVVFLGTCAILPHAVAIPYCT